MRCEIGKDGSISVIYRGACLIGNMYPGVDGHNIRALETKGTGRRVISEQEKAEGDSEEPDILWKTADGNIRCRAASGDKNSLELLFSLRDWKEKIHTFSFLYQADVSIKGFYQAAEGMGGDTGYYAAESLLKKRNTASYGLCSLDFGSCALTIYSVSAFRYETVFELDAYEREKYTDGWSGKTPETVIRLSCGARLEETNGEKTDFAALKFLVTATVEEGTEQAAKEIGRNMYARLTEPPAYHWCSWYYCYQNFDMMQLREYLTGLKQMKEHVPVRYFQVDAGYFPSAGDWLLPNERFENGLEEAFREISEAGYRPGIWIGPFMVGNRSRLYREHPDWILYDLEEKPVRPWITDNEPKPWGYQDEEYYVLDTSHPEAMEYMRQVFTTLRSWGAVMFKTDFMLWGLQDSSRVRRYTPGKTSVEYFREFLQMIREAIGEESYWLGCIAPFLPFVGYADGMRIGGDVGSDWDGEFGPQNMLRCLTGNNYTNHNYYQTDPDAVMLRDFHIRLKEREIHSLALLAAVSGSCIYTSDPLHLLPEDRQELFRFIQPDEKRRKPSLPFLSEERPEIVMTHREGERGLLYILNRTEEWLKETYTLEALGFSEEWKAFRFDTGEQEILWKGRMVVELPPHGCRLLLMSTQEHVCIDRTNLWKNLK